MSKLVSKVCRGFARMVATGCMMYVIQQVFMVALASCAHADLSLLRA